MRADTLKTRLGLASIALATLVLTGCGDRTTIINVPPPPQIPNPEGELTREEAEFQLQDAYEQGRRVGRRAVLAELSEEEREAREEARERRHTNWMRRRQQMHREILVDTLADQYGQEVDELVVNWEDQNQDEAVTCDAQVEEDPIEVDTPLPEEEDEDEGGEADEVEGSGENLDCWSRLCPSVASVITEEPEMRERRPRPRRPEGRIGPTGWIGYASGEDVELDEIGVELPEGDSISADELRPLLTEAYEAGYEDGAAQANLSEEERDERAAERWAEREQDLKERMEERLQRRLEDAIEECLEDAEGDQDSCDDSDDESCDADEDLPEGDSFELDLVPVRRPRVRRVRRSVHRRIDPDGTVHERVRVNRVTRFGGLTFEGQTDDYDEE